MKALQKDFLRGLVKNKGKFISVFFIILLGSAVFSGLRSSRNDMLVSAEKYYDDYALYDLRVAGTAGLTDADLADISSLSETEYAEGGYSLDALCNAEMEREIKLISLSDKINVPTVVTGRLPSAADECFLDRRFARSAGYEVGDTISFVSGGGSALTEVSEDAFTVTGCGDLPYYMDVNRGTGSVGSGEIEGFAVILPEAFDMQFYTEIFVSVSGAKRLDSFGEEYDALTDRAADKISALEEAACLRRYEELCEQIFGTATPPAGAEEVVGAVGDIRWYVLDRSAVASCVNYENDAERIARLGKLLPVIFFLVAALVSLTAMTRMVEEERQIIGTLKALGCGNSGIMIRYVAYALLPTVLGAAAGVLIGEKLFPFAIIKTYALLYTGLPYVEVPYNFVQGITAVLSSVLCTGLATVLACFKVSHAKPAQIMRPESPKSGKRVLIERIPLIWKRLKFTQKATVRNLFRSKKRFLMTVIGVAGCMGLVMVGLGLHDSIMTVADKQFTEITHYKASADVADADAAGQLKAAVMQNYREVNALVTYEKAAELTGDGAVQTVTVIVPQTLDGITGYFTFRDRKSHKAVELPAMGAVISEKTASTLGISAGDTVALDIGAGAPVSVTVSDIFENYIGNYLFVSPALYSGLYGGEPQYNTILMEYPDDSDGFQNGLGQFILASGNAKSVSFVSATVEWADDTLSSLNTIVIIVLAAAALLAFVVLYNLNSINIAERSRELATLKVLGFYDTEVAAYVYKENFLLTLIGIVLGIGVGIILHMYVIRSIEVDLIMFGRSIAPVSFLIGAAITAAFAVIVNLAMYPGLKRTDMLESLKSVE